MKLDKKDLTQLFKDYAFNFYKPSYSHVPKEKLIQLVKLCGG